MKTDQPDDPIPNPAAIPGLSRGRVLALRVLFAFVTLGQMIFFWPQLLSHSSDWATRYGNTAAILCGMSVLTAVGIRHPIAMLPILLLEFVWKCLWLALIYLPLALAGQVSAATRQSFLEVTFGVILVGVMLPWGFILRKWLRMSQVNLAATLTLGGRS